MLLLVMPRPKVIFHFPDETKRISVTCFVRVVAVCQYLLSTGLSWIPWKKNDFVIHKFRSAVSEFQIYLIIGASLKAKSSLQESLLSCCKVSYDCTRTGRYLPYATCPENGDNVLPRDVFNHVPYTWHYKPEVHQVIFHRRWKPRSCIVSWLVLLPRIFTEKSWGKHLLCTSRSRWQ